MKTIRRMLLGLGLVSVFGCLGGGSAPGSGTHFSVTLVMAKAPALNEPVVLTTTVTANKDMRADAYFNLFSARAEILSGADNWSFDLTKDVPAVFTTTMRFIEERGHTVVIDVSSPSGYHADASVHVYVTRMGGTFDSPILTPGPRMLPTPTPAPQGVQGTWRVAA